MVKVLEEGDDPKVLIHFDGWGELYDYAAHLSDADLHPAGYCAMVKHKLEAPKNVPHATFRWQTYLETINQRPVSSKKQEGKGTNPCENN